MGKLKGRIAAITGAAQGIGAAAAKRFMAEDVEGLALIDMNLEKVKAVAAELDPSGKTIKAYKCDVSDFDDTERCFNEIFADFGRVDVLVNSAGITRDRTLCKMSKEEWYSVIGVDLNSMFNTCRQVCPGMKEREYGKIVNMSSIGYLGGHGQTNYAAAKAGVLGFTRSLAKELAKHNVSVNAICPAAVDTDMIKGIAPELLAQKMAAFPKKRPAKPEELASIILFLACEDSDFINGEKIVVTDSRMCS